MRQTRTGPGRSTPSPAGTWRRAWQPSAPIWFRCRRTTSSTGPHPGPITNGIGPTRSRSTVAASWAANRKSCTRSRAPRWCGRPGCAARTAPTWSRRCCAWPPAGGPMRFVDDQRGCPTFTEDLAGMILQLGMGRRAGIYHVTNQGPTTWFDFARDVVAAAGLDPGRVEPITTAELSPPRPAPRPGQFRARQRCPSAERRPPAPGSPRTAGANRQNARGLTSDDATPPRTHELR